MKCLVMPFNYFTSFRENIIGNQQHFESPYGVKRIVYADWTATGRGYYPIERYMLEEVLPFVGNTHTGSTVTGSRMSEAYAAAKRKIKEHVHAGDDDVLLFCGSGMTGAVHKLQRMLKLRQAVVFVTAMEHHSNHISWMETGAVVEVIGLTADGFVDLVHFGELLDQYRDWSFKIAAVTACSNVTGMYTPYHEIAGMIHGYGGYCFVDFACAAPYCEIDMHPGRGDGWLDAVYYSSHKLLGGPGTPGVLIFNKGLYNCAVPDQAGGGTVIYTNPWGERVYVEDIEVREDGGTPPFLMGIKAGLCVELKEEMGMERMRARMKELLGIVFDRFAGMQGCYILQGNVVDRSGIVSFVVRGVHYNLVVRLLNDRFGVQVRGGCSCAGTYGHVLLKVGREESYGILRGIQAGDLSGKPGWVRLSLHPTMTDEEVGFVMDAIGMVVEYVGQWGKEYEYDAGRNEFVFRG